MNIDKRWLFLAVALSAAAGAAVTSQLLRRRQLVAQHRDHAADLKAWENEGGNLALAATGLPSSGTSGERVKPRAQTPTCPRSRRTYRPQRESHT